MRMKFSPFDESRYMHSAHSAKRMKRNGGETTSEYFIPCQLSHQALPSRGSVHPMSFSAGHCLRLGVLACTIIENTWKIH